MDPIQIDSIHIERTYGGVMEGRPSYDYIEKSARSKLERLFGTERPVLVLEPKGKDRLPRYQHICWLTGPALQDGHGSHLFVICWLDEPCSDVNVFLSKFQWAEKAQDFEY